MLGSKDGGREGAKLICAGRAYVGYCPRTLKNHMGGCQNYGPFLSTLNIRCRIIIGIQKGTIILTTTRRNHSL